MDHEAGTHPARRFDLGAALVGLVFAVLGVLFLLDTTDIQDFRFEVVLPGAAMALGVAVILGALARGRQ